MNARIQYLEPGIAFDDPTRHAVEIVSAYVRNHFVPPADLPGLIASVHASVVALGKPGGGASDRAATKATEAEIRGSITHEALISFEDGKPYKTLRRHLTLRGLSPEAYRAKHGLPVDYPMTAQGYSDRRSELAHSLGLGQQRRKGFANTVAA